MEERKNEIILFENQGVKLEVNLKDETVWLNRQQMATLFNRDVKTIGKHKICDSSKRRRKRSKKRSRIL